MVDSDFNSSMLNALEGSGNQSKEHGVEEEHSCPSFAKSRGRTLLMCDRSWDGAT